MKTDKSRSVSNINDEIRAVLESGTRAVLVTVLESPQLRAGAKLLVKEDRQTGGDLGDARLNNVASDEALRFLAARTDARSASVAEFAPDLSEFSSSSMLFERIEAEPHLIVTGAGHVGASLARLAAVVGYRVTLIDDRAEFVARDLFNSASDTHINLITAQDWGEAIRGAVGSGRGVSIAIVTRGHKQDEDCLQAALSANLDYIGMIGSKRRTNIVLDKLREVGFAEDQLKKVRAPIGLDIGAVSPEEVALAILAEIVTERRGGSGSSLSSWRRN